MSSTASWLARLRQDLARLTAEAARVHWPGPAPGSPPYFNYRLEHVRQVERHAQRLLASCGGDQEIVLAAVWLHDRFQPQFEGPEHAVRGAAWAHENLAALGFPAQKVEAVVFAVAHHSDPPGALPREAKEARILWDADKLAKVGPTEVAAFLCSAPAFADKEITFGGIARQGLATLKEAEARLGGFYFEASRHWAREAFAAQRAFYEALAREVGGA